MEQTTFLEMLNTVEVNCGVVLDANNEAYIAEQLQKRDDVAGQLQAWRAALQTLAEKLPAAPHQVEQHPNGLRNVKVEFGLDNFYKHKFSPLYALEHIDGAERNIHREAVGRIVNHLNEKYHLALCPLKTERRLALGFRVTDVAQLVLEYTDGMRPADKGEDHIKTEFRKHFPAKQVTAVGARIRMLYGMRFNPYQSHGVFTMSAGDERMEALAHALLLFDLAETALTEAWKQKFELWNRMILIGYQNIPGHNRFRGLSFFKNGWLDLLFADQSAAADFMCEFVIG